MHVQLFLMAIVMQGLAGKLMPVPVAPCMQAQVVPCMPVLAVPCTRGRVVHCMQVRAVLEMPDPVAPVMRDQAGLVTLPMGQANNARSFAENSAGSIRYCGSHPAATGAASGCRRSVNTSSLNLSIAPGQSTTRPACPPTNQALSAVSHTNAATP